VSAGLPDDWVVPQWQHREKLIEIVMEVDQIVFG
jgi:hypothetical protein